MRYETHDITLAATLAINGFHLATVYPRADKPDYAVFQFTDVDGEFLEDYDLDTVRVEPKHLTMKLRHLTGLAQRVCKRR